MSRELVFRVTAKDCRLDTFRAGGKGGQNQNKTSSGVRWTHPPSGAVGESREERSQWQNKKKAWRRMAESPKFQAWAKLTCMGFTETVEQIVEREMASHNLVVEVQKNGKWVKVDDKSIQ